MKKLSLRIAAVALSASLMLSGGALAADLGNVGDTRYAGTTIDINSKFDYIMQYVDWFSLGAEGKDVLRQYFNQYFEDHPEEFVALVNDIMQSIDEHSMYMSAEQYAASFGQTLSDYVGIGITLQESTGHTLVDVYENGPAYEAGLRAGDTIIKISGADISKKTNDELTVLLRGEENSSVGVTVLRGGKELTYTVTRRKVTPVHVSSKTLSKSVEYLRISSMGTTADIDKFKSIWDGLAAKDTRAAIIDLRGNGGGLVDMATTMIETIASEEGQKYLGLRYRADEGGLKEYTIPGGGLKLNKIVILVDGGTASASEIVAGSLSDLGYAQLLGTKTYGKGVGQYHFTMPDGSMLILTNFEMQLPKRGAYEGDGLVPDLVIELDGTVSSGAASLLPLDLGASLKPGDRGDAVLAMTQRLSILGYLDSEKEGFDAAVLDAVRRFQRGAGLPAGLFAPPSTLAALDARAKAQQQNAEGLDNQLATALEMCKLAAQKPAQYTMNADGTFTNR